MEPTAQPKTYFSNELPANTPLYHYTDAGGLLGMVKDKKLWLTNIHYQNDGEEFYYAINLAEEVLLEHYPKVIEKGGLKRLLDKVFPIFCFSLSSKGDSLSQWRGYAPNGGYAVSFQPEMLKATIDKEGLFIGECLYDEVDQIKAIMDNVIGYTPEQYYDIMNNRGGVWPKRISNLKDTMLRDLARIAPLLKNPAFSGEHEWRLIKDMSQQSRINYETLPHLFIHSKSAEFQLRARKNLLIPYIEIHFAEHEHNSDVAAVVVGPTPHPKLAAESCQLLLSKNVRGYSGYKLPVTNSAIPYINW